VVGVVTVVVGARVAVVFERFVFRFGLAFFFAG
jgi:hypothetical protein